MQVSVPSESCQGVFLAWKTIRDHHKIAGAYHNGKVVFWNLPTNSPVQQTWLSDDSLKLLLAHY
jgi:general transcription factor 3C polypeptide 2